MSGIIDLDSARGRQLGFTSDRFHSGSYLWDGDDGRVWVSAIFSKGKGNFRSLVEAIRAEKRTVAIPTPLPQMLRIVEKNGYQHLVEQTEEGPVDVWVLKP